jgi:hypothetical protein
MQAILSPQRTPRRRARRPRKLKKRGNQAKNSQTPSAGGTQAADSVLTPVRTPIKSMLERTQSTQTAEKLTDSLTSSALLDKENAQVNTPEKLVTPTKLFDMAELKAQSPRSPLRRESALRKQLILSPSSPIRRSHRLSGATNSPLRLSSTSKRLNTSKRSGGAPAVHTPPAEDKKSSKRAQRHREALSKSLRRSLCHEISASSAKKQVCVCGYFFVFLLVRLFGVLSLFVCVCGGGHVRATPLTVSIIAVVRHATGLFRSTHPFVRVCVL